MRNQSKDEQELDNCKKFYGKVPVGTKGQIVIPAEARKVMGISPGDNVIIISGPPHYDKILSLIPEGEFNKFLRFFEEHFTNLKKVISK
jgi:AbrB family looped-hinge helix DNA binding protein